jgi:Zn-dependent metalloprotease
MRRAPAVLAGLALLATLLVAAPVTAQAQRGPRVVQSDDTDAPSFVTRLDEPARRGKPAELARSHLSSNRSLYEIGAPASDLEVIAVDQTEGQTTVRFQQLYQGVEVFGAHYLVHLEKTGAGHEVSAVNGDFFTELNTNVKPRISEDQAARLALARQRGIRVEELAGHGLVVLPTGDGVATYHFTVTGRGPKGPVKRELFLSAQTGAVALSYDDLHRADPVLGSGETVHGETVDLSLNSSPDGFEMRGLLDPNPDPPPDPPVPPLDLVEITTHDAGGQDGLAFDPTEETVISHSVNHFDGPFTDMGAVDAHWGTERVFEFYKELGRNSIDNDGMPIVSVVNAGDVGGVPMYNAFWDGTKMVYGNPEGPGPDRKVNPLSADLDIVGHELTHGVIEHSAGFVYLSQSGAMNEAYADYFGNAVDVSVTGTPMDDETAGYIAEDICVDGKTPLPGTWECPFLRDLNDGRTTADYGFYLVDYDNGGVHLNSTIFGGALWEIRERLDPDVADQIMYRALTFGTPLQDFYEGREAVILAAKELDDAETIELTPEEHDLIADAFNSRGLVEGWDDQPGTSDAKTLIEDVVPLGFYHAAPQVSGSRFVVGNYADKAAIFDEPQEIVIGRVSGADTPTKINNSPSNVVFDELPDIDGEEVVWARGLDAGGGDLDFDVINRKLGGGMRTIANTSALEWFPSIDGNLVAWESLNNQTNIWARRIGRLPRRISGGRGDELYPQVAGRKIAWWDIGNGLRAPRIGIKDFKTGAKTTIKHSNPNAYLGPPALNDKFVFWFQDRNNDGTGAIMRAKHNGKNKKALVKETHDLAPFYDGITLEPPHISANNRNLVYVDEYGFDRDGDDDYNPHYVGRDVWLVSVNGGEPRLVTCNRGDQGYPSIGNRQRTVWLDGSLGRTDLMTRSRALRCRLGDARLGED